MYLILQGHVFDIPDLIQYDEYDQLITFSIDLYPYHKC